MQRRSMVRNLAAGLILLICAAAMAQDKPVGETRRPGEDRPVLPGYLPEANGKPFVLPPAPVLPETVSGGPTFELKGVVFEGNTVFSDQRLNRVAEPFLGHEVDLAQLEELRYRLTRLYVDAGYVNSGAVLKPGQTIDDGVVAFTIREGRLGEIRVAGTGRLQPDYVRRRLWPEPEAPLNTSRLQERFQLLLQDPLIERMNGRIRPGDHPAEAVLDLEVAPAKPYSLELTVDNQRPPSTGAFGGMLSGAFQNLTGYGDRLACAADFSEGTGEISIGYVVPLLYSGTRLSLGYSQSQNDVVEAPLEPADIESESRNAALTMMHPLIRNLRQSLEVGASLALRQSETFLMSRPFSFSPGADDGKSRVTALRLIQAFQDRTPVHALAARSTFSFGLDLLDATVHDDDRPDGRFVSWLGQFQYAHRIGKRLGQVLFRGDLQLAEDDLLPLERFALGGAYSVRGYRENEKVRDNGCALSVEWRFPLFGQPPGKPATQRLQIAPFMDFGMAWNKGQSPEDHRLHSLGVGLLWENRWIDAALYVAHALETAAEYAERDLQDDGVHFRCRLKLF